MPTIEVALMLEEVAQLPSMYEKRGDTKTGENSTSNSRKSHASGCRKLPSKSHSLLAFRQSILSSIGFPSRV